MIPTRSPASTRARAPSSSGVVARSSSPTSAIRTAPLRDSTRIVNSGVNSTASPFGVAGTTVGRGRVAVGPGVGVRPVGSVPRFSRPSKVRGLRQARIAAMAGAGEVLVSSTVKDLVAGSGLRFADRGVHALKGVPGEWHVFAVES
jgi:hypothetical protein